MKSVYFKIKQSKFLSVIINQGLMSISTFMTTIVLARVLTQEEYANFVLIMSIVLFILGIQSSLITVPFAISLNDIKNKYLYFFSNVYFKFIFSILLIIFSVFIFFFQSGINLKDFYLFILFLTSYSFYYFIQDILLSQRLTKRNLINGLFSSFSLIILAGYIYFYEIDSLAFYLNIASLIYLVISFIFFYQKKPFPKIRKIELKKYTLVNWKVGKWLFGSNILFHFSTQIYPWLLLILLSKKEVAIYGVLISVVSLVKPISKAISSYLLPIFVKNNRDKNKIQEILKQWVIAYGFMSFFLVLIGIFFGDKLVTKFFGNSYSDLGVLVILSFVNQSIILLFEPVKIIINAIRRTEVNFYGLLLRSILALLFGYTMIAKYGIIGGFIAQIIVTVLFQIVMIVIYKKFLIKNIGISEGINV